jgi:hypothetical protein
MSTGFRDSLRRHTGKKTSKIYIILNSSDNTSKNMKLMGNITLAIYYTTLAVNLYILLRFSVSDLVFKVYKDRPKSFPVV